MNLNLLAVVLGVTVVLFVMIYGLRFLYGFRVCNHAIEVVLFGVFPVYQVRVEDVAEIKKVPWRDLRIGGGILRLGNQFAGQCVLIQKRTGWFRRVVITPKNPDAFISQVIASR